MRLIGTDVRPDAVGRFWVESFHAVPNPEDSGYIDRMNALWRKHRVDLVVPQTTRETVALAGAARNLRVPAMVSGSEAVRVANNKASLMKVFEALRLPVARFSVAKTPGDIDRAARRLGYPDEPVVIKPAVSFGSRGFRVLSKQTSWTRERFLAEKPGATEVPLEALLEILGGGEGLPEFLLMEFLPGVEYTVDAFRGEEAEVAIPRRRDRIVNGVSFDTTLEPRGDISEYTLKAARKIGLRYAFGFQFKLDREGVPKVLECNPRVQGTMAASVFSGVNIIRMAMNEALGRPQRLPKVRVRTAKFQRYWGGVASSGERVVGEL